VKVSAIIESANYDTLTVDELFSKLKATEVDKLSRARLESPSSGRPMALVGSSSANANPNLSSGFALSSLMSVIEEQMETLDDDSLALVIAKFQKFYTKCRGRDKEGRSICYNCGDKNHFMADCPKKRGEYKDEGDHSRHNGGHRKHKSKYHGHSKHHHKREHVANKYKEKERRGKRGVDAP
jgi:hypothetical protein